MTRDDIIRLAQQAGLHHFYDSDGHCSGVTNAKIEGDENDVKLVEMLAPFAALVAAAERKKCIEIVLSRVDIDRVGVADAIRARGESK